MLVAKEKNKTGGGIWGEKALLHRIFREGLTENCPLPKDLKQVRDEAAGCRALEKRTFQAEETASAKALRQQVTEHVPESAANQCG